MKQNDMILAQETIENTEKMLNAICSFRLKGGCGSGIKNHCFERVMTDRCSRCPLSMTAEEHKKALLRK